MLNYLKIIKQKLTILCHNHLFRADHPFTIETLVEPFCPVNSHKAGAHRFIIGDTFRVETLHLPTDFFGQDQLFLLRHLIVAYDYNLGIGGNK